MGRRRIYAIQETLRMKGGEVCRAFFNSMYESVQDARRILARDIGRIKGGDMQVELLRDMGVATSRTRAGRIREYRLEILSYPLVPAKGRANRAKRADRPDRPEA